MYRLSILILLVVASILVSARAASTELISIALTEDHFISLPVGTLVRDTDGEEIAVLTSIEDIEEFTARVRKSLVDVDEFEVFPTPAQPHRRIQIAFIESADYADDINRMSRLEFLMHMTMMHQAFLASIQEEPGRTVMDANSIVFHNKYRGMMFFSISVVGESINKRLIFDVFRNTAGYSAVFHWSPESMDDVDHLMQDIIDSVNVSP